MNSTNPLLDLAGLPRFDVITAAQVTPAVDHLLAQARATLEQVATDTAPADWDNVAAPLAESLDCLARVWGAVSHINAVVNTAELRDAYNTNLPKVIAFHTDVAQDERLFARYRALRSSAAFATLDPAQQRAVDNDLRDFRLGGAELPAAQKARFKAIKEELAELSARFDEHVLDATNAWALYVEDDAELAGVPADVIEAARAAAAADGRSGCKLTLRIPCFLPVMQYAQRRNLRQTMYQAYWARASATGSNPAWDNGPLVDRILALRFEAAGLLGFGNYAEVSLVPKMAKEPSEVVTFLRDLARRARPYAERDYAEVKAFARDELGIADLASWDLHFASEALKAKRYSYSEQALRQYFPEDQVLAGLYRVVETIYGVQIRESTAPTWHPAVRFFELRDAGGELVGQFYLDLYAREGKQGGAWMDDAINRRTVRGTVQHPVAYLTCNLSPPVGGHPATFTHDEVVTIFHEFGHGLHQLLTRIDTPGVSGIEGVEWDAVELPSQFMENFCWEWEVVRSMSSRVGDGPDAGTPLPRELFDRMLSARNFQSGMATLRQVELGLFDMLVHAEYHPSAGTPWATPAELLAAVRREVSVVPRPPEERLTHTFGHIFAGGYAAGYYSYKWAEVLSADAYSLFEETGVLSPDAGARFRDEVLGRGGSRPALESFVAFRGRPPQLDALLRHNGMVGSH